MPIKASIPRVVNTHIESFGGDEIRSVKNSFFGRIWIWIKSGHWLSSTEFKQRIHKGALEHVLSKQASNGLTDKVVTQLSSEKSAYITNMYTALKSGDKSVEELTVELDLHELAAHEDLSLKQISDEIDAIIAFLAPSDLTAVKKNIQAMIGTFVQQQWNASFVRATPAERIAFERWAAACDGLPQEIKESFAEKIANLTPPNSPEVPGSHVLSVADRAMRTAAVALGMSAADDSASIAKLREQVEALRERLLPKVAHSLEQLQVVQSEIQELYDGMEDLDLDSRVELREHLRSTAENLVREQWRLHYSKETSAPRQEFVQWASTWAIIPKAMRNDYERLAQAQAAPAVKTLSAIEGLRQEVAALESSAADLEFDTPLSFDGIDAQNDPVEARARWRTQANALWERLASLPNTSKDGEVLKGRLTQLCTDVTNRGWSSLNAVYRNAKRDAVQDALIDLRFFAEWASDLKALPAEFAEDFRKTGEDLQPRKPVVEQPAVQHTITPLQRLAEGEQHKWSPKRLFEKAEALCETIATAPNLKQLTYHLYDAGKTLEKLERSPSPEKAARRADLIKETIVNTVTDRLDDQEVTLSSIEGIIALAKAVDSYATLLPVDLIQERLTAQQEALVLRTEAALAGFGPDNLKECTELTELVKLLRMPECQVLDRCEQVKDAVNRILVSGLDTNRSAVSLKDRLAFAARNPELVTAATHQALEVARAAYVKSAADSSKEWHNGVLADHRKVHNLIQTTESLADPRLLRDLASFRDRMLAAPNVTDSESYLMTDDERKHTGSYVRNSLSNLRGVSADEIERRGRHGLYAFIENSEAIQAGGLWRSYEDNKTRRAQAFSEMREMKIADLEHLELNISSEDVALEQAKFEAESTLHDLKSKLAELERDTGVDKETGQSRLQDRLDKERMEFAIYESQNLQPAELELRKMQLRGAPTETAAAQLDLVKQELDRLRLVATNTQEEKRTKEAEVRRLKQEIAEFAASDIVEIEQKLQKFRAWQKTIIETNAQLAHIEGQMKDQVEPIREALTRIIDSSVEADLRQYACGTDSTNTALDDFIRTGEDGPVVAQYTERVYNKVRQHYPFDAAVDLRQLIEDEVRKKLAA